MLAFRARLVLIIGSNKLAATRAFSALESDSKVVILAKGGVTNACEELKWRSENGELEVLDFDELAGPSITCQDRDVLALKTFLDGLEPGEASLVFITDTLIGSNRRSRASAVELRQVCKKRNIPVNITDMPGLCDFTVCATHRFSDKESERATSLQIAVTTNGKGCRLSGRLKRELAIKLSPDAGVAVDKIGRLRELAKSSDTDIEDVENELNEELTVSSPNRPVEQRIPGKSNENESEKARRRMKWVAQISEYWSLSQLAALREKEMIEILDGELNAIVNDPNTTTPLETSSQHGLLLSPPSKMGRVLLVGSGPGHPSLLTLAAHSALTRDADIVLTDKLVPTAVLALIPSHVEVHVARKFPGNAEGAQQELMDLALAGAKAGKTVVRLKQGDPALYGRVGEELLFLRAHGIPALIIPGISSALAAPLLANIPVTQRGAADSLAVCTGVGRGGARGRLPGYERSRTSVILMGVARLQSMVEMLLEGDAKNVPYPSYVPVAIIERASMLDQRVITARLSDIVEALDSSGEQRPPGLLVIGWSVLSLFGEGDMTVLDEKDDNKALDTIRVDKWLEGRRWRVVEGLDPLWDMFNVRSEAV